MPKLLSKQDTKLVMLTITTLSVRKLDLRTAKAFTSSGKSQIEYCGCYACFFCNTIIVICLKLFLLMLDCVVYNTITTLTNSTV